MIHSPFGNPEKMANWVDNVLIGYPAEDVNKWVDDFVKIYPAGEQQSIKDQILLAVDNRLPIPERTIADNGLDIYSNTKHTLGGNGNRANAGIEPRNSLDLFNNSIADPGNSKVRYAVDAKGEYHQFLNDNNGAFHWAGATGDVRNPLRIESIPVELKRWLGGRLR